MQYYFQSNIFLCNILWNIIFLHVILFWKLKKIVNSITRIDRKAPSGAPIEFNRGYFVAVSHSLGNSRPNLRVPMNKDMVLILPPPHAVIDSRDSYRGLWFHAFSNKNPKNH